MSQSFNVSQIIADLTIKSFRGLCVMQAVTAAFFASAAYGNVVGSDFQNFNPTTNGVDFVTVQSAQTLKPGVFNLGLFANYAVNAIPEFENDKPVNYARGTTRNTGTFSDLNFGLGLTKFMDVGLSFPAIVSQSVKSDTARLQYESTGINEFRFNSKLKIIGNERHGLGIVGIINMNRVDNNPFAGENSGPIYTAELVGHTSLGQARVGANAQRFRAGLTP